ncbi:lysozyme inhibitor LprI family protein [Pantoea ananatis]|uniref:lysozyme inhibitor LprI family protein n=1 Tax=Pantoea ananas TaxID=553 RepID=UPI0009B8183F|nr:lysozyme inhibitor LprI family protein [Pantoea ananatis]
MLKKSCLFLFIASLIMPLLSVAESGRTLKIDGKWKVEHVYIDGDVTSTNLIALISDDPTLRERIFEFTPNIIKTSIPTASHCDLPDYDSMDVTSINALMSRTTEGQLSDPAKSYALPVKGTLAIRPYRIHCQNGKITPSGENSEHWLVKLDEESIFLNWDNQSYLLLKKLADDAKVQPSFACAKATSDSEKTICHNSDLSSWDVSVAQAYNVALKQIVNTGVDVKSRSVELRQAQKRWLNERNACSVNPACLKKKMQDRVDELVELAKQ